MTSAPVASAGSLVLSPIVPRINRATPLADGVPSACRTATRHQYLSEAEFALNASDLELIQRSRGAARELSPHRAQLLSLVRPKVRLRSPHIANARWLRVCEALADVRGKGPAVVYAPFDPRELREHAGLTQVEMALFMGISLSGYRKWEQVQ
jgi:hypothetical protein